MRKILMRCWCWVFLVILMGPLSPASADVVSWTDWTSTTTESVLGTLTVGSTPVGVTFTGPRLDALVDGSGVDYWTPSAPYVSATVDNAPNSTNPPGTDIIRLLPAGQATITFSQSVHDPLVALVSWNGNTVDFNTPIEFLSFGQGFWGNGTPVVNAEGDGFFGNGEVHGVLRLPGDFTSISFSHTLENWHGFTVGAFGLGDGTEPPPVGVPEPGTLLLFGSGLLGVGAVAWRGYRRT